MNTYLISNAGFDKNGAPAWQVQNGSDESDGVNICTFFQLLRLVADLSRQGHRIVYLVSIDEERVVIAQKVEVRS